ncbi:PucR family transcriptional regulator [Nesterenkonia sp. MY13]|uniref:PucR family transcriptional regulator n=1 Tax=Nesterenkonia sedimenti TaxID=1463632 RepID=A0A7X8TK93_9MICC|nr:helix-turn-helix domain-containing protein [Nesterenkonia sedimenti]NLS09598.1 PucR family transcriptional regulator [Nesterenkonia sedimenti]
MDLTGVFTASRNTEVTSLTAERRAQIMESLLDSMNQEDPMRGLVLELGKLCSGSTAIFSSDAEMLSCAGAAPFHLIRASLDQLHGNGENTTEVGRWSVRGSRVTVRAHTYTVVLAAIDTDLQNPEHDFALDVVHRLLGSLDAVDSFAAIQLAHRSGLLLKELELGIPASREPHSWRRMSEFGFTPFSEVRVLAGSPYNGERLTKADLRQLASVSGRRRAVLVQEADTYVRDYPAFFLLTAADRGFESWLQELEENFLLGVSEEFVQLSSMPEVLRATELAHSIAVAEYSAKPSDPRQAVKVESLRPHEWLLARISSTRDRLQLKGYAAELRAHPEMLHTAITYLVSNMDIAASARCLMIHPNTMRYRLSKVEAIIGDQLNNPEVIADLYLSLSEEIKAYR